MVPLDEIIPPMSRLQLQRGADSANPAIGSLKLTMEKFYRVNGGSTQLKGVTPDILLPEVNDYLDEEDMGERRNKSALSYDEIAPAKINFSNKTANLQQLAMMSKSRVEANPTFKLIQQTSEVKKKDEQQASEHQRKGLQKGARRKRSHQQKAGRNSKEGNQTGGY